MLEVILRVGPLEGQRVRVSRQAREYAERFAGKRLVYRATGEIDPPTDLPKFALAAELDPQSGDWSQR